MTDETTLQIERNETIEFEPKELSRLLGQQYIDEADDDRVRRFGYLAAIAIDGMAGNGDLPSILMEYIENERTFRSMSDEEAEFVDKVLREAFDTDAGFVY